VRRPGYEITAEVKINKIWRKRLKVGSNMREEKKKTKDKLYIYGLQEHGKVLEVLFWPFI